MQINSIIPVIPQTDSIGISRAKESPSITSNDNVKSKESPWAKYDVHHMSLNDLNELSEQLYNSGQISIEERLDFTGEKLTQELFGGIGVDDKVDMVSLFKEQIDNMKSQPGSIGMERLERSLSYLEGVEARNQASIPQFI